MKEIEGIIGDDQADEEVKDNNSGEDGAEILEKLTAYAMVDEEHKEAYQKLVKLPKEHALLKELPLLLLLAAKVHLATKNHLQSLMYTNLALTTSKVFLTEHQHLVLANLRALIEENVGGKVDPHKI